MNLALTRCDRNRDKVTQRPLAIPPLYSDDCAVLEQVWPRPPPHYVQRRAVSLDAIFEVFHSVKHHVGAITTIGIDRAELQNCARMFCFENALTLQGRWKPDLRRKARSWISYLSENHLKLFPASILSVWDLDMWKLVYTIGDRDILVDMT